MLHPLTHSSTPTNTSTGQRQWTYTATWTVSVTLLIDIKFKDVKQVNMLPKIIRTCHGEFVGE